MQVLSKRLGKAASRISRDKKTKNRGRPSCGIEISALDDDDRDAMEAAQHYGPTTSILFPIRLRELPSSKTLQEELDSQICVVFYNAGITQLLNHRQDRSNAGTMGETTTTTTAAPTGSSRQQPSLTKACRLLSTADAALSRSIHRSREGVGLENVRVILLASLVLANLSVTYRYQDESRRVAMVEETLMQLERQRVAVEKDTMVVISKKKLAAAAA